MITESMRKIKARVDGGGTAGALPPRPHQGTEFCGAIPGEFRRCTACLFAQCGVGCGSTYLQYAFALHPCLARKCRAAHQRSSPGIAPDLPLRTLYNGGINAAAPLRENAAPLINVLLPGLRRTLRLGIYIMAASMRPRYCAKKRRDFPRRFAPSFLHRELERAAALSKFQSYPAACTPGAVAAAGELAPPSARIQAVAVVSEMNFRTSPTPTYFSALPSFITTSVGACLTPSNVASSAFSLASSFL